MDFPIPTPAGPYADGSYSQPCDDDCADLEHDHVLPGEAFDSYHSRAVTMGALGMNPNQSGPSGVRIMSRVDPVPKYLLMPHPSTPIVSDTNPVFIPQKDGTVLNVNTGQVVDGETADLISSAAVTNPGVLGMPLANLPPNLLSPAMEAEVKSSSVATAGTYGIGPAAAPSGIMAWFQGSTSIFGTMIPNWGFVVAGGVVYVLSQKKGRR